MNHCNCPNCSTNDCPSGVEYNACSAAFDRQQEQLDRNADQLAAAIAQRDKAVVALKHYGQHVDGCVDNESVDCICGYTKAMKECGK
jgi:hypothetical protein